MKLTYFELFAGAGGLSRGLEMAGWACLGHAEIEPHARAVLRKQWPDTPLFGDVSALTGAEVIAAAGGQVPLMLTGGSPCQDLSVAGKRAGLAGARSGLFHQQMRLWDELGSTYCLWENVLGALSSNRGADFAAVLSAFVGSPVTVPRDGWRGGGGVVAGRTGVAAWRVLDCQYFGPPQRRRRVFVLGVRTRGCDPGEVLLEATGGEGYQAASSQATEAVACVPSPSVAGGESRGVSVWDARGNGSGSVVSTLPTTNIGNVGDFTPLVVRMREGKDGGGKGPLVSEGTSLTLGTGNDQVLFARQRIDDYGDAGATVASTVAQRDYKSATDIVVAPTFAAGAHPGGANGQDAAQQSAAILAADSSVARPRRLMPIETERLMGWPDHWTAEGVKEDGTVYALSDTARYRLCGNGVASPVVAWIAFRLRAAEEGIPTNSYEVTA